MLASSSNIRDSNRCDQCIKLHRKCDREKPKCTYCTNRKVECTYLNKRIYKKALYKIENNISTFKLDGFKGRLKSNKLQIQVKCCKQVHKRLNYFNIISFEDFYIYLLETATNSNYNASHLNAIKRRIRGSIDAIENNKMKYMQGITNNLNYNSIIYQAYSNFYKYHNKNYPLFINISIKKNELLNMVIILAGLNYMIKDKHPNVLNLFYYLENIAKARLKIPYKLAPSITNLQTISILLTGLIDLEWTRKNYSSYLFYCERIAINLGLLHIPFNINIYEKVERFFLYININKLLFFHRLFFIHYHMQPINLNNFKRLSCYLIKKNINNNLNQSLIMHNFQLNIYLLIYNIRSLKLDHINNDIKLSINTLKLMHQLQKLKDAYISIISKLNNSDEYQLAILIYYHYLRFIIYGIKQTHTNSNYFNDRIKECKLVIKYLLKITTYQSNYIYLTMLTHCFVFLYKHQTIQSDTLIYLKHSWLTLNMIKNIKCSWLSSFLICLLKYLMELS